VLWRVEPTAVWAQLVEPDPEMAMALPQLRSTLVRSGQPGTTGRGPAWQLAHIVQICTPAGT